MTKFTRSVFLISLVIGGGSFIVPAAADAAGPNLIQNASLEAGFMLPTGWEQDVWQANNAFFTYPVTGFDGNAAARVEITDYTDGDAKWFFEDVAVASGQAYLFSNQYRSDVNTELNARYTLSNGVQLYVWLADVPASTDWQQLSVSFTAPAGATSITIFQLLGTVGWLETDQYSLTRKDFVSEIPGGMVSLAFDDGWRSVYQHAVPILNDAGFKSTHYIVTNTYKQGHPEYMTKQQILNLQAQGHEIGGHSRTHASLISLTPWQAEQEISGSRSDLFALGIGSVRSFAYPYGYYNEFVKSLVQDAGYDNARGIITGNNITGADPYLLKWQGPQVSTTVSQMQRWIDSAVAENSWLILSFHEINNGGRQYSTRPEDFQAVVNYLKSRSIKVVTVSEGYDILRNSQ